MTRLLRRRTPNPLWQHIPCHVTVRPGLIKASGDVDLASKEKCQWLGQVRSIVVDRAFILLREGALMKLIRRPLAYFDCSSNLFSLFLPVVPFYAYYERDG